jgi:hypothetical protein
LASLIETDCSTPEPQTQQDILESDSFLAPFGFLFWAEALLRLLFT